MLEVTINGKLTKVPPCTCGKCIVRRLRKDFFNSFPYNKDLASTYKNDYDWKTNTPDNPDEVYNRSKHNGFEGAYKEHIPTSLISTMKMDYKPFKVQIENKPKPKKEPFIIPFMGRTTNQTTYPNWGAMVPTPDSEDNKMPDIHVPLRGQSNYVENYPRYDEKFYKKGEPLDFAKATLNFYGKINPRTTYGDAFKPVDFGNPNYFPKEPLINTAQGENSVFSPCNNQPGTFDSTYKGDDVPYDDKMCKLRKYLNAHGMRYLEI